MSDDLTIEPVLTEDGVIFRASIGSRWAYGPTMSAAIGAWHYRHCTHHPVVIDVEDALQRPGIA